MSEQLQLCELLLVSYTFNRVKIITIKMYVVAAGRLLKSGALW